MRCPARPCRCVPLPRAWHRRLHFALRGTPASQPSRAEQLQGGVCPVVLLRAGLPGRRLERVQEGASPLDGWIPPLLLLFLLSMGQLWRAGAGWLTFAPRAVLRRPHLPDAGQAGHRERGEEGTACLPAECKEHVACAGSGASARNMLPAQAPAAAAAPASAACPLQRLCRCMAASCAQPQVQQLPTPPPCWPGRRPTSVLRLGRARQGCGRCTPSCSA